MPAATLTYAHLLSRLAVDLVAIAILAGGLYLRRHARRDVFTVLCCFNVGLFVVLALISERQIGIGVGFGLFAILSIIRLRSEPFSNIDLGYFFLTLVLALVNGIGIDDLGLLATLDAIALIAVFLADNGRLAAPSELRLVFLDGVRTDPDPVRRELEERYAVEIIELSFPQIDEVREITRVEFRCRRRGSVATPPVLAGGTR